VLKLCEDVYRAVGADEQAAACRDRRRELQPRPATTPLWPLKEEE
jgi:hypothetical protein